MKISGNTILITGGSSGIGFEFAKRLSALGNTVIITGRNSAKLQKAQSLVPALKTLQSDVSESGEIEALYQKVTAEFPALNVLLNNAGIMNTVNMHVGDVSLENLTEEIDINLKGPIRMVKTFLPHLKKRKEAAIVNVTSGLAFVPLPTSPIYSATKAGLHSFTRSLRVQLKQTNVKVFEVAPPATRTELLDSTMNPEDMKGISIMKVEDMVEASLKGFEADRFEICPGQSMQLKFMSRIAPEFILKQLSKPMDRMLNEHKI